MKRKGSDSESIDIVISLQMTDDTRISWFLLFPGNITFKNPFSISQIFYQPDLKDCGGARDITVIIRIAIEYG